MAKLKFKRLQFSMVSRPRDWIDTQLPKCPFCKQLAPPWEVAGVDKFGWNRYYFRCPICMSIISIIVEAITADPLEPGDMVSHRVLPKRFRIEDVGSSGSPLLVGGEISVDDLRKLAGVLILIK
jgi:hypothetical protein